MKRSLVVTLVVLAAAFVLGSLAGSASVDAVFQSGAGAVKARLPWMIAASIGVCAASVFLLVWNLARRPGDVRRWSWPHVLLIALDALAAYIGATALIASWLLTVTR